jgi:hypothetical protein
MLMLYIYGKKIDGSNLKLYVFQHENKQICVK